MSSKTIGQAFGLAIAVVSLVLCAGCPAPNPSGNPDAGALSQTVYVAHSAVLVSYEHATGAERPGTVTNLSSPTDLQALADGTVMVNLTGLNQILAVDGKTMLETARLPSSTLGATRPV